MELIDILVSSVFLLITLFVSMGIGHKLRLNKQYVLLLVFYHTFFSVVYFVYVQKYGGDANAYFDRALEGYFVWAPGTSFVTSFTSIFAGLMHLDKLNVFLIYNLIGLIGLLIFVRLIFHLWPKASGFVGRMHYWIVFMPGLSFWTSAIGKDAPAFLAACLALYSFIDIRRKYGLFATAVVIMFVVRPHMAVILLTAAGISLLLISRTVIVVRSMLLSFIVAALFFTFPFVQYYVGLEDATSLVEVTQYIEQRANYNQTGGGAVDIAQVSFVTKLFTYLFRPLFLDAPGLMGLLVSVENLFLLVLFLYTVKRIVWQVVNVAHPLVRFSAAYFLVSWVMLAMTTANLGIAVRQKTMLLPAFLVLVAMTMASITERRKQLRRPVRIV